MKLKLSHWALFASLALSIMIPGAASAQNDSKITVFAAASMKNALDAANQAWAKEGKPEVTVSYAASSTLANQIEKGAPADVFISADLDWMAHLKSKNMMKADSISNFLGNRLVLIAPKDSEKNRELKITAGMDLSPLLGDSKIAMGTVDAVPAGKYGKAAFEKLGIWDKVSSHVAQTESVRAALLLVSRKEAPLGVVYQTDAAADKNVAIIGVFPEDTHPRIIYPIGITVSSKHPGVADYVNYLKSDKAKPFFEEQGFTVLASDK